jgi:hypothetical protein
MTSGPLADTPFLGWQQGPTTRKLFSPLSMQFLDKGCELTCGKNHLKICLILDEVEQFSRKEAEKSLAVNNLRCYPAIRSPRLLKQT